jgi:hypothetical protein
MKEQTETTTAVEAKRGFNWWGFVLWPLMIAAVYFLSLGPFLKVTQRPLIPHARQHQYNQFRKRFYGPWFWIYRHTPLHKPLGLYMNFWAPKIFNDKGEMPYSYYVPMQYAE